MTSSGSDATSGATQGTPAARRSAARRPASVASPTPAAAPGRARALAAPVPPSPAAATPAPPVHAAGDSGALGVELRAVDRARDALQRGDASGALRALASYERDAPERQLALEVARLRMEAHAALGEHAEARALAAEILAQRPSPQHARRAREVLGGAPAER